MKASIQEILEEHQELINRKADGSIKDKNLTTKALYRKAYNTFKKMAGARFSPKSLTGEHDPGKISHMLAVMLQGGRVAIAKSQKAINSETDGSTKLKKFIPAVFGRLVGERLARKTGITLKQTTLGKGGYSARNPDNQPDHWEKQALQKVMTPGWALNKGIGEVEKNHYRYLKPIYIKKACLGCHGAPKGEKGPYGHPREGYQVGDVRGGISVSLPLE